MFAHRENRPRVAQIKAATAAVAPDAKCDFGGLNRASVIDYQSIHPFFEPLSILDKQPASQTAS